MCSCASQSDSTFMPSRTASRRWPSDDTGPQQYGSAADTWKAHTCQSASAARHTNPACKGRRMWTVSNRSERVLFEMIGHATVDLQCPKATHACNDTGLVAGSALCSPLPLERRPTEPFLMTGPSPPASHSGPNQKHDSGCHRDATDDWPNRPRHVLRLASARRPVHRTRVWYTQHHSFGCSARSIAFG